MPKTRGPKVRGLVVARVAAFAGQQGFWTQDVVWLAREHTDAGGSEISVGGVRDVQGATVVKNNNRPKDTGEAKWMRREEKDSMDGTGGTEWDGAEATAMGVTGRASGRNEEENTHTRTGWVEAETSPGWSGQIGYSDQGASQKLVQALESWSGMAGGGKRLSSAHCGHYIVMKRYY